MHKVMKVLDKTLNGIVTLLIVLTLLYSAWGIYDVGFVYTQASSQFKYGDIDKTNALDKYKKKNSDVCALLEIPNTGIKYPVVQGETNDEYLNKTVDGKYAVSGSIFIDVNNSRDFTDYFTLFYGHRMEASAMFGDISKFTEKAFFNNHKEGTLTLEDGEHKVAFFACSRCLSSDMTFFNVDIANSNHENLMKEINRTAVQSRDVSMGEGDTIIALSTCEGSTTSGRIILFGLLKGV